MSRPADQPIPEGYGKVPGLPMMRFCQRCSAVVIDPNTHDQWHATITTQIKEASLATPSIMRPLK